MREPKALFLISLFLFLGVILQSTLFEFLKIFGVKPDLCLMLIIYAAIYRGSLAGMLTGFGAGLLNGFFSQPFGFHSFIYTVVGYFLGKFEGLISLNSWLIKIILVFASTIAKGIFTGLGQLVLGIAGPPFFTYAGYILLEAFYNALLSIPLFFIFQKISIFKEKKAELS